MRVITQGAYVQLPLTLESAPDVAHNLTGATFESKLIDSGNEVDTYDNAHHTITDADDGELTLTLSAAETAALKVGTRELLIKVTQSGNPTFYRSYCLTVKSATPES